MYSLLDNGERMLVIFICESSFIDNVWILSPRMHWAWEESCILLYIAFQYCSKMRYTKKNGELLEQKMKNRIGWKLFWYFLRLFFFGWHFFYDRLLSSEGFHRILPQYWKMWTNWGRKHHENPWFWTTNA